MKKSGMSVPSLMIVLALVAMLAVVVASLIRSGARGLSKVNTSGVETDLESKVRAATLSTLALSNTKAANTNLSTCITATTCNDSTAQAIELRNAANSVIIPLGSPAYIDDSGNSCDPTTNKGCRWAVSATYRAICATYPCHPASIQIDTSIAWNKPDGTTDVVAIKPKTLSATMALAQFNPPPAGGACNSGEAMTGIQADGSPICTDVTTLINFQCRVVSQYQASGAANTVACAQGEILTGGGAEGALAGPGTNPANNPVGYLHISRPDPTNSWTSDFYGYERGPVPTVLTPGGPPPPPILLHGLYKDEDFYGTSYAICCKLVKAP